MKIKIVGWLFIITAPIFILAGVGMLLSSNMLGLLGFCLGVYAFILGSAIKAYKKWSWYAGIITILLATIGNLASAVMSFTPFLIVPLFLDVFVLYALIVDRNLFLHPEEMTQPPPQSSQTPVTPSVPTSV